MKTLREILGILASLLLCLALAALALLFWDLRAAIGPSTAKLNLDLDEIHRATLEIGLTAENLRKASAAWQASSQSQAQATSQAAVMLNHDLGTMDLVLTNLNETTTSLDLAIGRTDQSLNGSGGVLPKMGIAADELAADERELRPALENAAAAASSAQQLAADPDLAITLHNLADTSASAAATSANIDATTGDIRAFVHRETTPVRGTWNVIKSFLMEFAGPLAEVATATKRP